MNKLKLDDLSASDREWIESQGIRLFETGDGVYIESVLNDAGGDSAKDVVWKVGPLFKNPIPFIKTLLRGLESDVRLFETDDGNYVHIKTSGGLKDGT